MNNLKNQVTLIGNLGMDLEPKSLSQDRSLARGSIAVSEYYKNSEGEKVQNTQWLNFVVWGKLAENMAKITSKGDQVMIQGKLKSRSYEDSEGRKQYITEIVVNEFMITNRPAAKKAA